MLVRWWALVLAAVAAILLAPSLLEGTLISHSSPQNLTWAAQFADLFRAGILYPRWLPRSFEGLGSPAFYFYPPIAFWVDAVLSVVTFDALPVSYRLSLSSLILLWVSGVTMHAWLKAEGAAPRIALYGALAYVLVRSLERWHWRALVIAATILLIFLLALSSLYFGASQLSDAVAAMIEGVAWLIFCVSGVEIVRWRENARGNAPCN